MFKIRVKFIVVLVVIALVALLVIQAFQTAQLYDRKSTKLKDTITTSLERIAIRHEKAEDIRRYLHIIDRDFSGQYKDVLKEEFKHLLAAQESISIHDTSFSLNGKREKFLIIKGKTFDTISGLSAEQKVIVRDVRHMRELLDKQKHNVIEHNSDAKLAIELDQRVMQQIFKKAKFINELMIQAFRDNVYEDPTKRIDVVFLDSVIRTELANDDVPKTYKFFISDNSGKILRFDHEPSTYERSLDTSKTDKTFLFPSNTLDEDLLLHLYFPKKSNFLFTEMYQSFLISFTLMALIVVALMFMFRTIMTQHKLSEMKNDFISNMTHEFKTPISTISLACEALNDPEMLTTADASKPFVHMISEENKRLGVLVENILQSAVLDKGKIKLKKEPVDLLEVLHTIIQNAKFRMKDSGGTIELMHSTERLFVETDKMHLTNVLNNLVDNAIKYSKPPAQIEIHIQIDGSTLYLEVRDKGIGIEKEHLDKIFDKLYRIPTGNIHNVKGFGLGLSYVKAIADLNNWKITVKSTWNEGSTFQLKMKRI